MLNKQNEIAKSGLHSEIKDYFVTSMKKENNVRIVLTVPEVAKMLQWNVTKTYAMVKANKIPHIKDGNRIIIPVTSFVDWLDREAWKNIA